MSERKQAGSEPTANSVRITLRTVGTETVASFAFHPQQKQQMPPELLAYFLPADRTTADRGND